MDEYHDVIGNSAWIACMPYECNSGSAILERRTMVYLHHTHKNGCYLITPERSLTQSWMPTAYC